jgi:P-type Cu+ transporter
VYSASGYWRAAARAVRSGVITIDVPIAIGIAALFAQSVFEITTGAGEGYLDSFTGLVFFLLCGAWFQRKTYDTLSFDHDYRSYFPLSVVRRGPDGDARIPVADLAVGDRVVIRNGELLPADAVLVSGRALLDFSFVTGESEPAPRAPGEYVYAGGRQVGEAIELEIVKPVSQGYLTSLWNQEAFHPDRVSGIQTLTDRLSRRFTWGVIAVAAASAAVWCVLEPGRAVWVFSSVLIVACPCALALSAPFTLGTALRVLGRNHLYLRNAETVEALARVDRIVFDKTGTLTRGGPGNATWEGAPLTAAEQQAVHALTGHSTHPHSVRLHRATAPDGTIQALPTDRFREVPGAGIEGLVEGRRYRIGSRAWTGAPADGDSAAPPADPQPEVHLAVDDVPRGRFRLGTAYRHDLPRVMQTLRREYPLALLSGDQPRDADTLRTLLGPDATLAFDRNPHQKLAFVRDLQQQGHHVLMIGDGLNDAGALKQGDVGIALTEDVSAFAPACDGILDANAFPHLPAFLRFSRSALRIIKASFAISLCYNLIGISVAAQGLLSPVIAAILMPLSSVSRGHSAAHQRGDLRLRRQRHLHGYLLLAAAAAARRGCSAMC